MEGDATDSDGLEEFGRVLVLLVLIVIEERTDGLWLLWKEDGVALDLSGGMGRRWTWRMEFSDGSKDEQWFAVLIFISAEAGA